MRSFKVIRVILFLAVCVLLTGILNVCLKQYNIARVNVHRISQKAYDDIFVGTSHGLSALNPEIIDRKTGRKSTNICMPDEYLIDTYYLVKEACRKQKPKRIIYELDPAYWSCTQNKGSNAVYIYKEFPMSMVKLEYFMDKIKAMDLRVTLAPWYYYRNQAAKVRETVALKFSEAYKNYQVEPLNTAAQQYTSEGFMYQIASPDADKGGTELILWKKDEVQKSAKKYFKKLVDFCRENEIEFVAITTPVPKETLDMYRPTFEEAHRYYEELMKKEGIPYYDFNFIEMKGFDRSIRGYLDYEGHMTGDLGNQFSEILGDYL